MIAVLSAPGGVDLIYLAERHAINPEAPMFIPGVRTPNINLGAYLQPQPFNAACYAPLFASTTICFVKGD